jgi:hypothetical protein
MTFALTRPMEATLTNGTKRSRAVRVAGPGPAVREFISARQQMQSARAHAEAWYQALRDPQYQLRSDLVSPERHGGGGGRMVPVAMGSSSSMGSSILYTQIHTPLGWLSERAVSEAMRKAADPMLEPIKRGMGLGSLIHHSGRGWAGDQAKAYAHAVLTVAVALGDPAALAHISQLSNARD